jgi:hypothetical protein
VTGTKIKCKVKVNLNGKMGDIIKVNIIMIKKKDMENLDGQMEEDLKVNG